MNENNNEIDKEEIKRKTIGFGGTLILLTATVTTSMGTIKTNTASSMDTISYANIGSHVDYNRPHIETFANSENNIVFNDTELTYYDEQFVESDIVINFAEKLYNNMVNLEPEISQKLNEHFLEFL